MLVSSGLGGSSALGSPPTTSGSSPMPQMGQGTGDFSRTSGSMGQTQTTSAPGGAAGGGGGGPAGPGGRARKVAGSAWNFARHFGLQKYQVVPRCSTWPPLGALGFTSMWQTGSSAK